jgi:hypothetical protein
MALVLEVDLLQRQVWSVLPHSLPARLATVQGIRQVVRYAKVDRHPNPTKRLSNVNIET